MTGFRINQGGIFGMRTGVAAKTEGSTSVFVKILKEQKQASHENVPASNPQLTTGLDGH